MKPPKSNLVIANSSETVIPAAGGYGMKNFMSVLEKGFLTVGKQYRSLGSMVNGLAYNQKRGSQNAVERWKASMTGSMNVRSVPGNTMGSFGGSNVGDIYVTVNAGATSVPDQLAYIVAERIQQAVGDAVNASILV
jgi:hypothetical protein